MSIPGDINPVGQVTSVRSRSVSVLRVASYLAVSVQDGGNIQRASVP